MKEMSKPSMVASGGSSALRSPASNSELSTAARRGMRSVPDRRSQPLLIRQWKHLWCEEFVELRGPKTTDAGWVDDITADGATVWIHLSRGKGRVMIHHDDGIDIWRVDSRIYQNRSEPESDKT
jgi:hypothetical protein